MRNYFSIVLLEEEGLEKGAVGGWSSLLAFQCIKAEGECFTWHIMSSEESKAGTEDTQKESLVSVSGKMFSQLLYC